MWGIERIAKQEIEGVTEETKQGELFALLLELRPTEDGHVAPSSGTMIQAAFLQLIRQYDPDLSAQLHEDNQKRPYTLSLLQGFEYISRQQYGQALSANTHLTVSPERSYWLRITILDPYLFQVFLQQIQLEASALRIRIGEVLFRVVRLVAQPENGLERSSWVGQSSFQEIVRLDKPQSRYTFTFMTPTTFSKGQKQWGRLLDPFPSPSNIFGSLARRWEAFSPLQWRLAASSLTPYDIEQWCCEQVIVAQYQLETQYVGFTRFGLLGFVGSATYEVKGRQSDVEARLLPRLARFAFFSGLGYKTGMGLGQARLLIA